MLDRQSSNRELMRLRWDDILRILECQISDMAQKRPPSGPI